jgi:uncharacterized protein
LIRTLVAITGASSGLGETFARRLAPGHDLLLIARRKDRLDALAAELTSQSGAKVEVIEADLTNEQDLARVAERLGSDHRLALLVNNAGFGTRGRFWESPLKTQEDMHKLHVMATVRLTHAALRNMVARDLGGIINVASVAAFVKRPGSVSYAATKTWMTTFTEALHLDLKNSGSNVAVQALCPGFTYTEFHDRMGVDRRGLAPDTWWHSAEDVVEASLDGLRQHKLFVVPGWRYRWLVAIVTKLPAAARLFFESRVGQSKPNKRALPNRPPKQVNGSKKD